MPRRGFVPKREVLDDPIYGGKLVTKLVNQVMLDGKRGTAQKACYGAFDIIKDKTGREPLEVFEEAMNNIMPVLEVKARRVGGAGWWSSPASAARRPRPSACATRSSTPPTTPALPSSARRTCTRWPRPTRRSRTIVGNMQKRLDCSVRHAQGSSIPAERRIYGCV